MSLPNLRVWVPIGYTTNTTELPPSDSRHLNARRAVDRGLRILETPRGRAALGSLAKWIIVGNRKGRNPPCLYPRDDPNFEKLDEHITHFLKVMRSSFPEVYLTETTRGEALAVRYDRSPGADDTALEDYNPRGFGHLELNHTLLRSMTSCTQQDWYTYMFSLCISVGHEVGHFLTAYLTGGVRPETPKNVKIPGTSQEAGFFWELQALGGVLGFFSEPGDRSNVHQPGLPYLFPDGRNGMPGQRVSHEWIRNFVNGIFGTFLSYNYVSFRKLTLVKATVSSSKQTLLVMSVVATHCGESALKCPISVALQPPLQETLQVWPQGRELEVETLALVPNATDIYRRTRLPHEHRPLGLQATHASRHVKNNSTTLRDRLLLILQGLLEVEGHNNRLNTALRDRLPQSRRGLRQVGDTNSSLNTVLKDHLLQSRLDLPLAEDIHRSNNILHRGVAESLHVKVLQAKDISNSSTIHKDRLLCSPRKRNAERIMLSSNRAPEGLGGDNAKRELAQVATE